MLLAFIIWNTSYVQKNYFYTDKYTEIIQENAQKYNIDPFFISALIKNESKFDTQARSSTGALGLMQIMPDTGTWIARETKWDVFSPELLYQPDINIRLGTWYLSELYHQFNGNLILTLAAYNAGRGVVETWIKENNWSNDFSDINAIPYDETRVYVNKVLLDYNYYQKLYS